MAGNAILTQSLQIPNAELVGTLSLSSIYRITRSSYGPGEPDLQFVDEVHQEQPSSISGFHSLKILLGEEQVELKVSDQPVEHQTQEVERSQEVVHHLAGDN